MGRMKLTRSELPEQGAFWDDHARDMDDPEYRHHYVLESRRIAVIDAVINNSALPVDTPTTI